VEDGQQQLDVPVIFVILAILVVLSPELDTMDKELVEKKLGIPTLPNYFLLSKYKMSNPAPTNPGPGNTVQNLPNPTSTASGDATRKQVKVDLLANIDVAGNVQVFNTTGTTISDVVVCPNPIPASALYSGGNSILEFVEPSNARGTIVGSVSGSGGRVGKIGNLNGIAAVKSALSSGIQSAVCVEGSAPLDAADATPFKGNYNEDKHIKFPTFGELVLAVYAHYLFGHAAATAAIQNDEALVAYINSGSGAQIGSRLADAIEALEDSQATQIVRQVISQDPNRALGQDNNAPVPDSHQALEFLPGDVIYLTIKVAKPTLSQQDPNNGAADNTGDGDVNLTTGASYPSSSAIPSFTLEITLN
jgi:hypothetical protein